MLDLRTFSWERVVVLVTVWTVVTAQSQRRGVRLPPDDPGFRTCFICTDNGEKSQCEIDPAEIVHGVNHINCTKPYCTVTRIEHGGKVWSFERGCHSRYFGNACSVSHGGDQRVCTTTCSKDWCNSGPGLPQDPRQEEEQDDVLKKRRRRPDGFRRGSNKRRRRKNSASSCRQNITGLLLAFIVVMFSK